MLFTFCILVSVVFAIVSMIFFFLEFDGFSRVILVLLFGVLFFFGTMMCFYLPASSVRPVSYTIVQKQTIVSLNKNESIRGSFFIGSGIFEGHIKYYYYIKNDDGSYILGSRNAENTKIIEKNEQPRIEWTEKWTKKNFWFKKDELMNNSDYKLIVPPNTIIKEFKLEI